MNSEPFIIIGGGIAGLTAAAALLKKGFNVQVYERSAQLRETGAGLGISANAMMAMKEIGLEGALLAKGKIVSSIDILSSSGRFLTKASPGNMNRSFLTDNITLHRADLMESLSEVLPQGIVHTGKQAEKFKQMATGVEVKFSDGSHAQGKALIAADGIGSVVRRQLRPDVHPRYAGYTAWRGVIASPPKSSKTDRIIEMWGRNGRVGLVPLHDGRVYWFVCMNSRENNHKMKTMTAEELSHIFQHYIGPAAEIIRRTPQEAIVWTDIYDMPPLGHYAYGKTVLIGDAAHATTPNLGQGAGQAMEDAVILAHLLEKEPSLEMAFRRFEAARLKRTQHVIQVSQRIGKAAQLSSPILCSLRNTVMSALPQTFTESQFKFLFDADLKP